MHTHAVLGALGFTPSESMEVFVITNMISLCTDISSGSGDVCGVEDGCRVVGGGACPATAGG